MSATPPEDRDGGAGSAEEVVLGLLRTAGLDVALPLAALREVVPCPDRFAALPLTAAGLLGVMTLRGRAVPVVDLAEVVGRPRPRSHHQVVVVAHGGRVVGLLVDEVKGMAGVALTAFDELIVSGGPQLFSRTFHHPVQGHVVTLLDPDAVLALPGVPVVRERGQRTSTATRGRGDARSLTLVRCGAFTLGLDVAHVHSTVPSPRLRPSPADGPTCLGVTRVAGRDVAVVDLLALVGLGSLAGTDLECGVVLDLPDGQVVLGVGAMVGLRDVPTAEVVPLPAVASPSAALLTRVADVAEVGTCLVIDGDALLAAPDVVALSRVNTDALDAEEAAGDAVRPVAGAVAGPPHLAYQADVSIATPVNQIVEVLAYPEDLVPSSGSPEVLGLVVHRGVAVPVVCLATVLERTPPGYGSTARLLLVEVDGEPVAYAVSGLHAILAVVWTDPEQPPRTGPPLRVCPLVQLQTMDGLLPALDLHALTRRLRGHPGQHEVLPAPRSAPGVVAPSS